MYRFDLTGLTKENSFIHSGLNFVLYKEDTPAGFLEERVGVGFLQERVGVVFTEPPPLWQHRKQSRAVQKVSQAISQREGFRRTDAWLAPFWLLLNWQHA